MTCLQLVRDREMSVAHTTATHASLRLPFGTLAPILPPTRPLTAFPGTATASCCGSTIGP